MHRKTMKDFSNFVNVVKAKLSEKLPSPLGSVLEGGQTEDCFSHSI